MTNASYMTKYFHISSKIWKPFLIYVWLCTQKPFRIPLYMRKNFFSFLSVHAHFAILGNCAPPPSLLRKLAVPLFATREKNLRTYIIEYNSFCPFVGIGPPTPSPPSECVHPPWTKGGGGTHSPAGKGVGKSQFRRLEKSWALCLLCV